MKEITKKDLAENLKRCVAYDGSWFDRSKPWIAAGPCVVESEEMIDKIGKAVITLGATAVRGGCFKPLTFPDKNMTRAVIINRLNWLRKLAFPVVTEIGQSVDIKLMDRVAVVQIGYRHMFNTDFIATNFREKTILIKRHPGASLRDLAGVCEHYLSKWVRKIMVCERGIVAPHTHNPNARALPDITAIAYWKRWFPQIPIIFDPSHSTFNRDIVIDMALAAIAAGADGLLVDVHHRRTEPEVDPLNALDYFEFELLMQKINKLWSAIR